jgi:transcriptional regulator with XRE-family HTH domain
MSPTAPTNAQLGQAIRRLRMSRRLSIDALAEAAGIHPTYLSAIERGIRNPSWLELCDMAQALGIPLVALVRAAEGEAYGAMHVVSAAPIPADARPVVTRPRPVV